MPTFPLDVRLRHDPAPVASLFNFQYEAVVCELHAIRQKLIGLRMQTHVMAQVCEPRLRALQLRRQFPGTCQIQMRRVLPVAIPLFASAGGEIFDYEDFISTFEKNFRHPRANLSATTANNYFLHEFILLKE